MVFQPIVDLETEEVVGLEALARFPADPDRPTQAWFTEAAAVGLRLELELAAIEAALAALAEAPAGPYLSVNAMPDTLASEGLAALLTNAPADRLVLEITEHAPVRDYEGLNKAMQRMRGRGIRLAVDDAGSGFASLRHILQLAPDMIKIDNALTHNVYKDPARRALAAGLISFAAELGATIIAEGIETRQELDALRVLGVAIRTRVLPRPPRADRSCDVCRRTHPLEGPRDSLLRMATRVSGAALLRMKTLLEEAVIPVQDPIEALVVHWRAETLRRAGFAAPAAIDLAISKHVDLHAAVGLLERGCPPETALRILL